MSPLVLEQVSMIIHPLVVTIYPLFLKNYLYLTTIVSFISLLINPIKLHTSINHNDLRTILFTMHAITKINLNTLTAYCKIIQLLSTRYICSHVVIHEDNSDIRFHVRGTSKYLQTFKIFFNKKLFCIM